MTEPRLAFFGSSTAVDGGSELCLLRMAGHFNDLFPVTLFLPDDGPLFQAAEEAGIEAINLRFLRLRKHRGFEWVRWMQSVRKARQQLEEECRKRGINLIHFNDFIDIPYYSVGKKLRIPAVAHLRLIIGSAWVRTLYRSRVRSSGVIILPVSQAVSRRMIGSASSIRSRVIYDPQPDPLHFHPKDNLVPNTPFRLIMISKLLENKGHLNFCQLALDLEEKHRGKFAYTMVAPSSPGREEYEEEVRTAFDRLPKERSQFVPGANHSELGEHLRASDLLVHLPDTEDSFPGVVLEAMACGTPVMAHRVGGIPEQLEDGRAGLLVDQGDFSAVLEKVERIANQPEEWCQLAEMGIKKVSTDFSAETHFESLEKLYRDLLKS